MFKRGLLLASLIGLLSLMLGIPIAQANLGGAFTSGIGSIITNTLTFSGTDPDVTTASNEDFTVTEQGTGLFVIKASSGQPKLKFQDNASNQTTLTWNPNAFSILNAGAGASAIVLASGTHVGSQAASGTTTLVGCFSKNITNTGAASDLECVYGSGLMTTPTVQTGTCASSVISIDPVSSNITIDSNAGDCTATITNTAIGTIAQEGLPIRVTAKNVGAGHLKLASTNFASLPARCTSTGMTAGQSALFSWSQDQTKFTFLGGCE